MVSLLAARAAAQAQTGTTVGSTAFTPRPRRQRRGATFPPLSPRYEAILKLAPRLAAAYNNLGALYLREGQFRKAAAVLERGLTIDPAMSSASALLGISRYQIADYTGARAPLEKALRAKPNDEHAARFLAHDLIKLGDWDAALAPLQQLARREPKDQEISKLLGTVHMELSKRALVGSGDHPDSALVHQVSGEVMESMKNYDGALVEYKKSVEMAPDRPAPTTSSGTCIGQPLNGRRQRANSRPMSH